MAVKAVPGRGSGFRAVAAGSR